MIFGGHSLTIPSTFDLPNYNLPPPLRGIPIISVSPLLFIGIPSLWGSSPAKSFCSYHQTNMHILLALDIYSYSGGCFDR